MNDFNNTIDWSELLAGPFGDFITYNYSNFNYTEFIDKINFTALHMESFN